VSAPLSWDEVADAHDEEVLRLEAPDVVARVERDGDLWADAVTLHQELPPL
jgi:DNA primase